MCLESGPSACGEIPVKAAGIWSKRLESGQSGCGQIPVKVAELID